MLKVIGASWFQTKVISMVLAGLVALGVIAFIFGENDRVEEDGNYSATICWSRDTSFRISFWGQGNDLQKIPMGMARAHYKPGINTNGWAVFEVQTDEASPDWMQAYAAGYLEGSLSWQLIHWHWTNTVRDTCEGRPDFCQQAREFLDTNSVWVRQMADLENKREPFWHQVGLFYMQLDGLIHGWRKGVERSRLEIDIPDTDFLWMNMMSDLADLEQKFNSSLEDPDNMFQQSSASSLSSAFIKLIPETRQLLFAHNSGGTYQSMLKMMKRYELNYHTTASPGAPVVPGRVSVFSSYPAAIHSQDDFYLVSGEGEASKKHQLAVAGVAIHNNNGDLWNKTQPVDQVLLGPRVSSANRLAKCGRSWSEELSRYNSGTGNKQWMIADFGRLSTRPAPPKPRTGHKVRAHHEVKGLLWVVEQLPGLVRPIDRSQYLKKFGFWTAYGGLPFHKSVFQESNANVFIQEKSSIGKIFSRDQVNVTDLPSALSLMRNNEYLSDPLSSGNPLLAVAGRGDIPNPSVAARPVGAVDSKVCAGTPGKSTELWAAAGPTFSKRGSLAGDRDDNVDDDDVAFNYATDLNKPQIPPFQWSSSMFPKLSHIGQPDVWHFDPIDIRSNWVWTQKYEETF